jgi:hypothetical protein
LPLHRQWRSFPPYDSATRGVTPAKIPPGLALAALACLCFAPPLHAQETPTPATVGPSVYSSGAPGQPDGDDSRRGGHGREGGDRGRDNGDGANGGGGDRDDGQGTYGMSVTTLDASGGADPAVPMPLASRLETNLYAAYAGGGVGRIVAHYPTSSGANVAGEAFAGARLKYAGIEASWDTLGYYAATVNNQPVRIATDLFSASLLGFLPLGDNTDFYLRYGRTAWSVIANSSTNGALPVKSGTNALMGAGIEFRHNALLIRVEAKRFLDVFQSDSYNYTGLSVGGYLY